MKYLFLIIFSLISISGHTQNESQYSISNKIHLKGNDSFWDYLTIDSNGHLYVSHGSMVQIVDTKQGTALATIEKLNGVHGIAFAEKLNKGFISCGKDSLVVIFDLKTFVILDKVKVTGANPDAIFFDAFSNTVFTFNGRSSNATVIDANTHKILSTIQLLGKPEFPVSDNKGKIYVNIEDKSMISCINTRTFKVEKSWPIEPGEEPSGLAADFKNGKLFSVCSNGLMIIFDLKTEKVIESIAIGSGTDGAAFDFGLERAYSSNGEGTMSVVAKVGDKYQLIESFPTLKGARTICIDQKTHHLFLPTAEFEPLVKGERRPKMKPGSFMVLDVAPR